MQTSALFNTKNFGLFEIYGVSAQTRELSQCGQGGRFFAILCEYPLWTTPYIELKPVEFSFKKKKLILGSCVQNKSILYSKSLHSKM